MGHSRSDERASAVVGVVFVHAVTLRSDFVFRFTSVLMFTGKLVSAGWIALNDQILETCKELIDDAKMSSADLVFKETCLEVLSKARNILTERQFKQLTAYVAERLREKIPFEIREDLLARR